VAGASMTSYSRPETSARHPHQTHHLRWVYNEFHPFIVKKIVSLDCTRL
jgi:hypothetical protein